MPFPLPGLAPLLKDALDGLEHGRGVVLIKGLPLDPQDDERAARVIWGLDGRVRVSVQGDQR